MPGLFENTVSAICYEIATPLGVPPFNDVTDFVLGQWNRMPRFWAWPLRIATLAFALRALLTRGSVFHRLPPNRRAPLLESWRYSALSPCRDFIRFYRSLALMAIYSRDLRP
jgi:hypothetical protein